MCYTTRNGNLIGQIEISFHILHAFCTQLMHSTYNIIFASNQFFPCRKQAGICESVNLFSSLFYFQDLQSEIEQHQHAFETLQTTGASVAHGAADGADRAALSRRLDEMNQRWLRLRSKSVEIRSDIKYIVINPIRKHLRYCSQRQNYTMDRNSFDSLRILASYDAKTRPP